MSSVKYPMDEIRERSNLIDIVSQHVSLKKSGKQYQGLCPFHSEKTPSFYVSPEKGIWKCYGCGEGGDLFDFVMKAENLSFREAVEFLANKYGIKIEKTPEAAKKLSQRERLYKINTLACEFFRSCLNQSKEALEYLERRKISSDAVERYKLGFAPASWDSLNRYLIRNGVSAADAVEAGLIVPRESSQGFYDRFRERLMFPILDISNRVIAFGGRIIGNGEPKYLNSPETPLFSKTKVLYGINIARKAIPDEDKVIVVEGYMDALSAQEAGFPNTVATLGTALTESHVDLLARYTKNVILAYDADSAGMSAAMKGAPMFESAGMNVHIMTMPKGEDPDSILRTGDRTIFAEYINKAIPVNDYRLRMAVSAFDIKTADGKADALKTAEKILVNIESNVERERLIRMLARFHPNFSSGTTKAEDHIRADVERLRSQSVKTEKSWKQTEQKNAMSGNKHKHVSLRDKTEKLILGTIICKNIDPSKVFSVFAAKEFLEGPNTILAQAIEAMYAVGEPVSAAELYSRVAGTEAEGLLTDLIIGTDESEYRHPISKMLSLLTLQRKNESISRTRDLVKRVQEGSLKSGDPEFEEYLKLKRASASPFHREL